MRIAGIMVWSLAVSVMVVSGCGKSRGVKEAGMSPADRILREAMQQAETGDLTNTLAVVDKGLAELKDPGDRNRLFAFSLSFLLNQNQIEIAQERYLKALASPDDLFLARNTLGFIVDYLSQKPDGSSNVLAWCDRLEKAGLPENMKAPVLQNRLASLLALNAFTEGLNLIENRGWALPDEAVNAMCARFITAALAAGRADDVSAAIALLEGKGRGRSGMALLAASGRIDLLMARRQFLPAAEYLFAQTAIFDDRTSAGILDKLAQAATAAGTPEAIDPIAEKALAVIPVRPDTRARAAQWWLLRARDGGSLDQAVDRLQKLDGMGLPPSVLVGGVNLVSQLVLVPSTPPAAVKRVLEFVGALKPRITEEPEKALLAGIQLDGGFKLEDYTFLIAVLEAGVPGHDKAWDNTMINKIKAHQALKEGKTDEAVKRFRAFMDSIAAQEDQGHRDPVTDERVTKPMILGYNARRIGDILAAAGRAPEAAKAYAEAKGYYTEALKGFAEKDPETKTVKKIMAEFDKSPAQ